jgi:hypothetical protein
MGKPPLKKYFPNLPKDFETTYLLGFGNLAGIKAKCGFWGWF